MALNMRDNDHRPVMLYHFNWFSLGLGESPLQWYLRHTCCAQSASAPLSEF